MTLFEQVVNLDPKSQVTKTLEKISSPSHLSIDWFKDRDPLSLEEAYLKSSVNYGRAEYSTYAVFNGNQVYEDVNVSRIGVNPVLSYWIIKGLYDSGVKFYFF